MRLKPIFLALGLFPCAALSARNAAAAPPSTASPRQHISFDANWHFRLDDVHEPLGGTAITGWQWRPAMSASTDALPTDDATATDWKDGDGGGDVFAGRVGFAYYRASLPKIAGPGRKLHFASVDDNATIYVNGVKVGHHEGWDEEFTVPVDSAWHADGDNVVLVVVENTAGGGGISGAASLDSAASTASGMARSDIPAPAYDDAKWRTVHLPHDYVVEGVFAPKGDASHGSLPTVPAWYRKTFTLPAADKGKAVWIEFDGVYRDSIVYLNGARLGEHQSGYIGFRYDISKAAKFGGANVLAVHVDPRRQEGWWYEGGGIYRHVWLNVADPIHIAPMGGTYVSTDLPEPAPGAQAKPATVKLTTTIQNDGTTPISGCTVISTVYDDQNVAVAHHETTMNVAPGGSDVVRTVTVTKPRLWSIEQPRLYSLRTTVRLSGKTVDETTTSFGIRTLRWDSDTGFYLNGRHVEIKGTCDHQDFAGVGTGMPDGVLYWRIKKLKEMGSNAYRMSHNPPSPELLDACDRLGMIVMDENRHLGDTYRGKTSRGTGTSDLSDLAEMIKRDRNHPSIVMWSMCNEEPLQGSEEGGKIFSAMMDEVHKYDTTRPITCAMNGGWGSGISLVEDLQGCNYNPGGYDALHAKFPNKPMYGSETASEVGTRGIYTMDKFENRYFGEPTKGYVNAYDINAPPWAQTAEVAWKMIADRPYMAGGYVWTGFDYKGEPTPFGWPCINSHFGILDECGFPKDTYYYYQAAWGDKPIVHITPHWNWAGKEGQTIPVWVYSNGDKVELILNGTSLGTKDMPHLEHLEWSVPYAPGKLVAKSYLAGKLIATDVVETTGPPAAIRLSTDRTKLLPDSEDVTMVEVDIVDAQGRIVPTADNLVTFAVKGAGQVAGVGNGDPSSHEPDRASTRHAFNGKCMVLVGSTDRAGAITLSATASGLTSKPLPLVSQSGAPIH